MSVKQSLSVTQKSQNADKNRSTVRILWKSTQSGESRNLNERTAYYWISINGGTETRYSVSYTLPQNSTKTILDITVNVDHNANGTGSIKVRTWMDTRISAGEITKSKSLTLSTIARESTIGATDADIGAATSIVVARKNKDYTHDVGFTFGELSGYIDADGNVSASAVKLTETSIAWTIPTEFYGQIPGAKTGTCTLRIRTYSGNSQIGSAKTATFKVRASEAACAPIVAGTVVDTNPATIALTGDPAAMVQYRSNALCTIAVEARNGATVEQKKIGGTVVAGETRLIEGISKDWVSFYAQDSRGYEGRASVPFTFIPYVPLTCNAAAARTDPTSGRAVLTVKGNYYNGSFGSADNTIAIRCRTRQNAEDSAWSDYVYIQPTITEDGYTAEVELSGLDYRYAHVIEVAVADALEAVAKETYIHRGIPVYDWGENDFRVNVALRLGAANYGTELPETGVSGQVFFLLGSPITMHIHDGEKWVG